MGTGALANPAAVFASVLHAASLARLVAKKTCPARALVSSARLLETRGAYSASARSRRDAARRRRDVKPARGRRRLESHRRNQTKMGSKQQVPDGMLIGPKNPIIEEALGDRLIGGKREAAELSVADFDGSRWKLVCTPDQPNVATVHLDVGGWTERTFTRK